MPFVRHQAEVPLVVVGRSELPISRLGDLYCWAPLAARARSGLSVRVATCEGHGCRPRASALWVDGLSVALAVITLGLAAVSCCGDSKPVKLQAHFDWDFDPTQTHGTACESAWDPWRLRTLEVRMEHGISPIAEALPG
jgi:hypothetical protein